MSRRRGFDYNYHPLVSTHKALQSVGIAVNAKIEDQEIRVWDMV
jgi:hypothetical protein